MANQTNKRRGQAAGLLGVVALFSAAFALLLTRSLTDPYVLIQGIIGLIGVGIYLATNLGDMGQQFTGRGSFYNIVTAVFGLVLVAALAFLNYRVVKKPKQWDFTKDRVYSLSEQTQGILKSLKDEVKVRAFFSPLEPEQKELEDRLRQYKQFTDKLTVEFLDPSKHRKEVQDNNITLGGPRILVKAGNKESRAKDASEEGLTNAIAEVTRGGAKKIYFTKGHGEHALSDSSERGFQLFDESLKSEGFQTADLQLAAAKSIPADAQEIVIGGPAAAFLDSEVKVLKEWVDKGGKLMVLLDPGVQSGLEKMLAELGVTVGNDEVIDPDSQQPEYAITQEYAVHPVTKLVADFNLAMILPLARSVSKSKAPPAGWTVTELAKTGPRAWGETELKPDAPLQYDEGKDLKGPVPVAAAMTHGSGDAEARVVAMGNSTFAANAFFRFKGNREFALNAISWTAKDESKISIRPNRRSGNLLFLSADQKKGMFLFALNVLPFALLAAGLLVWQTRKSR